MRVTFTCGPKTLSFNVPIAHFKEGKLINPNPRIRFRNHRYETEDVWEIKQIREWGKKYPRDEIKELK